MFALNRLGERTKLETWSYSHLKQSSFSFSHVAQLSYGGTSFLPYILKWVLGLFLCCQSKKDQHFCAYDLLLFARPFSAFSNFFFSLRFFVWRHFLLYSTSTGHRFRACNSTRCNASSTPNATAVWKVTILPNLTALVKLLYPVPLPLLWYCVCSPRLP